MLDCRVGPDAGLADTNHEFAIVADFADADATRSTATTRPRGVQGDLPGPARRRRAAMQFEH